MMVVVSASLRWVPLTEYIVGFTTIALLPGWSRAEGAGVVLGHKVAVGRLPGSQFHGQLCV